MASNFPPKQHRGPTQVLDAVTEDDERSEVRPRLAVRRTSATWGAHPAERGERVDEKIRQIELLLTQVSPTDPRRRLIAVAILRRDEVLLDGLLADLRRHRPATPPVRRLSSHPRLKIPREPGSER